MSDQHPLIQYMTKKITVQMLEAHYNALPELLRYIIKKGETDLEARMALYNFKIQAAKEQKCLDPAEAVFGFATSLINITDIPDTTFENKKRVFSYLADKFCKVNKLGELDEGWSKKVILIDPNE